MNFAHLSEVNNFVEHAAKVRSDLNATGRVKVGKPEVVDSFTAVVGSLTDGADYCGKVCGVQLYEPDINVIVQWTYVAFWDFDHKWVSWIIRTLTLVLSSSSSKQ